MLRVVTNFWIDNLVNIYAFIGKRPSDKKYEKRTRGYLI